MVPTNAERAATVRCGSDPQKSSCLAADGSENSHSQPAPQETPAALQRDFAAEALHVAAIKAAHAADNVLIGDDVGAERDICLAISHVRAGATAFREQRAIDGITDAIRAEAQ
jgi:hypothetical protein